MSRKHPNVSAKPVYPDLSDEEIEKIRDETWTKHWMSRWRFEPFIQLVERARKGKYVNVSEYCFRRTKKQGPWPPDQDKLNIFILGGSATFGYGVPDDQTIASYMQEILSEKLRKNVRVYNFGNANFYITQERILFEKLLVDGIIPDMAIFIDGHTDFRYYNNEPNQTQMLRDLFDGKLELPKRQPWTKKLPLFKGAIFFKNRIKRILPSRDNYDNDKEKRCINSAVENKRNEEAIIARVVGRYLENIKIIEAVGSVYNVKPVFVWQPIPHYKYDLKYHIYASGIKKDYINGYPYMENYIKEKPLQSNFLWCADIQEHLKMPLYVDAIHYSAKMNKIIAGTIVEMLIKRNLLVIQADKNEHSFKILP